MIALGLLDLGYGNGRSVKLAFARLGARMEDVRSADDVERCERLVIPGVGHAGYAMSRIAERELTDGLRSRTKPTLGICLGMQLMFATSEESDRPLLGVIPGHVAALKPARGRPVPHMGWSRLSISMDDVGIRDGDHCYFAHGFAAKPGANAVGTFDYGGPFAAVIRDGPWWGAQFHPERSGGAGSRFLKAFLDS